jgi:hypothetical protein
MYLVYMTTVEALPPERADPWADGQVLLAGGNEDDAMVAYTFELLPEGGYAPTGVFRGRVKVDRPFPIDIDLPEVTWLCDPSLKGEEGNCHWTSGHRGYLAGFPGRAAGSAPVRSPRSRR